MYDVFTLFHGEAINLERNPLRTLKMDIAQKRVR